VPGKNVFALLLLFSSLTFSQDLSKLHVSVKELPPEPIPAGTCKESYSGYLEIPEHDKVKDMNFTPQQIGNYVKKRLSEGYSLSLYSQASGRLFVIETCQSKKD
jgi:hypothetical protein